MESIVNQEFYIYPYYKNAEKRKRCAIDLDFCFCKQEISVNYFNIEQNFDFILSVNIEKHVKDYNLQLFNNPEKYYLGDEVFWLYSKVEPDGTNTINLVAIFSFKDKLYVCSNNIDELINLPTITLEILKSREAFDMLLNNKK
jgi:hypothetical protein